MRSTWPFVAEYSEKNFLFAIIQRAFLYKTQKFELRRCRWWKIYQQIAQLSLATDYYKKTTWLIDPGEICSIRQSRNTAQHSSFKQKFYAWKNYNVLMKKTNVPEVTTSVGRSSMSWKNQKLSWQNFNLGGTSDAKKTFWRSKRECRSFDS